MHFLLSAFTRSQETLYVSLLIIITAVSLFALCGLSFMFGRKRDKHKSEFLKFWFVIPIWLLFLTVFIWIGQKITWRILPNAESFPIGSQLMAIAWGVIGIGFVAECRQFVPIPETRFFYSYMLSLMGLLNIEIFSAFYLPYVIMTSAEFVIIYLSRTARRSGSIVFYILFMLVPFVPNLFSHWRNSTPYLLAGSSFMPGFKTAFLASCLTLPFLLQCVRFLIARGLWHRRKGEYLKAAITGTLFRALTCFLIMIGVTVYTTRNPPQASAISVANPEPAFASGEVLTCTYQTTQEYGVINHQVTLSCPVEMLRYDVVITLKDDAFILFSDHDYTMDADSVVHFTVVNPDDADLVLSFSSSICTQGDITVTALDNGFYRIPVEYTL